MFIFGKTDIGLRRATNQDEYRVHVLDDDIYFGLVCDGMGGENGGNVASAVASETICQNLLCNLRSGLSDEDYKNIIVSAVSDGNVAVYDKSLEDKQYMGMGTTVVAALIKGKRCAVAHVGDSRAYLVNENITQLTRDHSVVQSLIESGKLTPEEARFHPRKNVITRALGTEEEVQPDCSVFSVDTGDTLLLCTDGLTNFVDTGEILDIFHNNDISRAADVLVARANHNGGGDNITAVTVTL